VHPVGFVVQVMFLRALPGLGFGGSFVGRSSGAPRRLPREGDKLRGRNWMNVCATDADGVRTDVSGAEFRLSEWGCLSCGLVAGCTTDEIPTLIQIFAQALMTEGINDGGRDSVSSFPNVGHVAGRTALVGF